MLVLLSRGLGVVACIAATVALTTPTATAGENTGNGKPTPVGDYAVPASICAFSGLNDVPDGSDSPGDPFAAGKVQSWGDIVQQVAKGGPRGASTSGGQLQEFKPGVSCNKNNPPPEE